MDKIADVLEELPSQEHFWEYEKLKDYIRKHKWDDAGVCYLVDRLNIMYGRTNKCVELLGLTFNMRKDREKRSKKLLKKIHSTTEMLKRMDD